MIIFIVLIVVILFNEYTTVYISDVAESIRQSWNGRPTPLELLEEQSYQKLYYDQSIDIVYYHQNRYNCSNVKYFASPSFASGFGSEIHMNGLMLAIAMSMNRVLLPAIERPLKQAWQTPESLCKSVKTLDCYYLPITNCTLEPQPIPINIPILRISHEDQTIFERTNNFPIHLLDQLKNELIITVDVSQFYHSPMRFLIPYQFDYILSNLSYYFNKNQHYYWWRAVSASYFMRLNNSTVNHIKSRSLTHYYASQQNKDSIQNGKCISVYIRYGDKASEMKLIPYQYYMETALNIWNRPSNANASSNPLNPLLIFGTETPKIFVNTLLYVYKKQWKVLFNPLQINIYLRKGLDISKYVPENVLNYITSEYSYNISIDFMYQSNNNKPSRKLQNIHIIEPNEFYNFARFVEIEYLSMIINLYDFIKCNYYVCTLASNYCRLIDEFRMLLSAKPKSIYTDLSRETCGNPPCILPTGIYSYDW